MQGILFIEPLYKKIVEGNKTMTRRAGSNLSLINENPDWYRFFGCNERNQTIVFSDVTGSSMNHIEVKPRYKPNEIVYIKEPVYLSPNGTIIYKYDNHSASPEVKWSNKLFMPAAAARTFIKITSVTTEKLLDITTQDCIKEGIQHIFYDGPESTKNKFLNLYATANGIKKKPLKNIWLFVYEFEHLKNYKHEM